MKLHWRYSYRYQNSHRTVWEAVAFVGSVNVAAIAKTYDGRWTIDVIDDGGHDTLRAAKDAVLDALEGRA